MSYENIQIEFSECGLACIAHCAQELGSNITLNWLRNRFVVSSRGTSLKTLSDVAASIGLNTRPLRCDIDELVNINLPAILHWNGNHFVVLKKYKRGLIEIFDPIEGRISITKDRLSSSFTGVLLEINAAPKFIRRVNLPKIDRSSIFRITPRIKGLLFQTFMLSAVLQIFILVSPIYMQIAVDNVSANRDNSLLYSLAIGFSMLSSFNLAAEFMRNITIQSASSMLSWDLSRRLFHHMIRLPLPWFHRRRLADTLSRFQSLEPIKTLISNGLISSVLDGVISVVTVSMMIIVSPILALISIGGFSVFIVLRLCATPYCRRLSANALQASILEQGKRIEVMRSIQTIKVMAGEAQKESEWSNRLADTIKASQSATLALKSFSSIEDAIANITMILVILMGIQMVMAEKITLGVFYAFISYRAQFLQRAANFFQVVMDYQMLDIYTARLADVVLTDIEPGVDGASPLVDEIVGNIEVLDLSFQYSGVDKFILKNVNLKIDAGQIVALIGPSGGGKTTLVKLLCGLYLPTRGVIKIDNIDIKSWGSRVVRESFGAVMQDDDLLPGTIAANVSFFSDATDVQKVWQCLSVAAIDEDVRAMSMGIDTFVGDLGSTLSGGQKQRLLLARALYKEPKILLLDEATAHLDVAREKMVSSGLAKLGITRIIVAHRPDTILSADRVIYVDGAATELDRGAVMHGFAYG